MKPRILLILLSLFSVCHSEITEKDLDKVKTIHINWYVHSIKALMVSLSKELLPKLDKGPKMEFLKCLAHIKDKKDITSAAHCLSNAKDDYEDLKERRREMRWKAKTSQAVNKKSQFIKRFKIYQKKKLEKIQNEKRFMRLDIGNNWEKRRMRMVQKLQKRRKMRVKRSLPRLVVDSVSKSDSHGFTVKSMKSLPGLKSVGEKTTVQKITNLFRSLFADETSNNTIKSEPWTKTYDTILKMKKRLDEREKSPGAKVYNQRMYDLVLDLPQRDDDIPGMDKAPEMLKQAIKLVKVIDKKGKKGSSGLSSFNFLSPRIGSVMPSKSENRGSLSPSLLSFYNDETEEQILPLPKMLDATGMNKKDRESMMEMIMELSGTKKIVYEAMKVLQLVDEPEISDAISATAKKTMDMVKGIQDSYSGRQQKEMKKKGFAILEGSQIRKLMEDQGIAHRKDVFDVEAYEKKSLYEKKNMVWDIIRNVAFGNQTHLRRRKRDLSTPTVLQPTVLSPVLFTPIYGLVVLSPTVLSPGLFTPLILNPSVLSPYVFSPTVGIPFILSPYVMSPYVFSPLVFAPFILNPYVLAPNVFNPYVLSPLILSPLVLCPDTVSPMVLGGVILSPGVLSPSVLSKSYLMANVLSPTVLSR